MNIIKTDCVVVGGGASGMMAAGFFAENAKNRKIILIEKNNTFGKKLLITGKGRCNVTNNCDLNTFMSNVVRNGRFLYSAVSFFSPADTIAFFESLGIALKTERGNRVFPVSDHSSDILNALKNHCNKKNISFYHGELSDIHTKNGRITSCVLKDGTEIECSSVILATGGKSYPQTGSSGDGYRISSNLGHTVTTLKPSLVPIDVEEASVCAKLEGLSLKNTALTLFRSEKSVYSDFGEMVFTSSGLSGPIVLSSSAHAVKGDRIVLDLKPALDEKTLDTRILSDFAKYSNKNFINALDDLLPKKLIPVIVSVSEIDAQKKVNSITKTERAVLINCLKNFSFTVKRLRPIEEAIITSGGVSVKEIDPKTMQSKIIEGLYFAGELIDCDAYTGGFNLQIAFSTGRLAGISAAKKYEVL
ncbi:MAG: NAD(P)/FAD-dependent oxidoreductase [Clostridia bacterium]|nr:NAD(P)/FAD-dependent oxidoreductase [Clostridia bacterium]